MPVWNETDDELFVAPKFANDMFLRYTCYDDEFGELGTAIGQILNVVKSGTGKKRGICLDTQHLGASNEYYQGYMGTVDHSTALYHICDSCGVDDCKAKRDTKSQGKGLLLHIDKFQILKESDAVSFLKKMKDATVKFQRHIRLSGKSSESEDDTAENEESEEEVEEELKSLGDDIKEVHKGLKAKQSGEAPPNKVKKRTARKAMKSKTDKDKKKDADADEKKDADADENPREVLLQKAKDFGESVDNKRKKKKMRSSEKKRKAKKAKDSTGGDSDSGSSSDMTDSRMEVKRLAIRRIAERKPGLLTKKGLAQMHNQLSDEGTELTDDQLWTPVCQRYWLSILAPNLKNLSAEDRREVRTLVTAMDLGVKGNNASCLDTLMRRFKAKTMSLATGVGHEVSQYLELIPVEKSLVASPEEEQPALSMHRQDLKAKKLRAAKTD